MSEAREFGVRPLVQRASHAAGLAHAAEAVLVGVGAGLFAAAGAVASGGTGPLATLVPSLLAGLSMGTAWYLEVRLAVGSVARRVDGRLRLGGGLVAAWEVEERGGGRLGFLLGRQLRARLGVRSVLAAAIPNSIPLLAVPLLGAASLVLAIGGRPTPPDPMAGLPQVLDGLAGAVEGALDAAMDGLGGGEVSEEEAEEMRGLASEARSLAHEAGRMGQDPARRAEVRARIERLSDGLEEAARGAEQRPDLAGPLEQALTLSDVARLAGEDSPSLGESKGTDPGHGPGQRDSQVAGTLGSPDGAGGANPASGGGSETGDGGPPLANGGGDGTMSAQPGGFAGQDTSHSASPSIPAADSAGGVALGPWWPERHSGVVRRYVEARRTDSPDPNE